MRLIFKYCSRSTTLGASQVFVSRSLAYNRILLVPFFDSEKVFERVNHSILWQKLAAYVINCNLVRVIRNIYKQTEAGVTVNGVFTDVFTDYLDCEIGVGLGDPL